LMSRPTIEYANDLDKTQWLSLDEMELLQQKKLNLLLQLAVSNSPWHAERIMNAGLGHCLNQGVDLAELRRLPLMTKQDAQVNRSKMVWHKVPGGAYKYSTGGSSGHALSFYFGKWRQASDAAGRIRARRWWGIDIGDKEIYLWGAPVELVKTDKIKQIRDGLMNQVLLNAFDMSPKTMKEYLSVIQKYEPKCLYGYASSIALLARFAQSENLQAVFPSLKVIFTTGEPLYPDQRKIIQEIFHVPVANEFGSRDVGFTAHESPSGQMLLMSESVILEILNNEGVPVHSGETGEAVVTGLCSQAQPFIRYRTGDMIKASDQVCLQNRGLHVLGEVVGRSTDFIIKKDGTILHALAVIYIVRTIEGVESFRVIQHSVSELEVQIVANSMWKERDQQKIVDQLQQRLGRINVSINKLDSIAPEKSGKHRYVISYVPLPTSF